MTKIIIKASSSQFQILWLEELNFMSSNLGTMTAMIALSKGSILVIVSQMSSFISYKFPTFYYLILTTCFLCTVFTSSFHQRKRITSTYLHRGTQKWIPQPDVLWSSMAYLAHSTLFYLTLISVYCSSFCLWFFSYWILEL